MFNSEIRPTTATNRSTDRPDPAAPTFSTSEAQSDVSPGHEEADERPHARISASQRIIRGLGSEVRFIKSIEGDAYIAFAHTPHRALRVDGHRSDGMRAISMREFASSLQFPSSDTLKQVENYVYAECMATQPVPVYLRVGEAAGNIYIDTGNAQDAVVEITPNGYNVSSRCPVLFRRSDNTAAFPDVTQAHPDLDRLRRYVRLSEGDFAVLVGCLIGTMLPNIPQPIMAFLGSAKAGKTTVMQQIVALIDPTTDMPGGTLTADPRTMKALASFRWPLIFDNVSKISPEESDLLARIATGGELIGRRLYSNDEAHVTQLKRPILINGIMDGFTRSDLASRTFMCELDDFAPHQRIAASQLAAEWERDRPYILAGLWELAAKVLAVRETTSPKDYQVHRNNDVMQIIDIVSIELGTDGVGAVAASAKAMSQAVLDSSYVAQRIIALVEEDLEDRRSQRAPFGGRLRFLDVERNADELLGLLRTHQDHFEKDRLTSPKSLGEVLRRIAVDLESAAGIKMSKRRVDGRTAYCFKLVSAK